MEKAIVSHEFEKARFYSVAERKEREEIDRMRRELKREPQSNIVSVEDIVDAVAERANVAPSIVKNTMRVKNADRLELIANELAARIPLGGREWAEDLVAYLAGCSPEEA